MAKLRPADPLPAVSAVDNAGADGGVVKAGAVSAVVSFVPDRLIAMSANRMVTMATNISRSAILFCIYILQIIFPQYASLDPKTIAENAIARWTNLD